jgi:hypothetical protein
VSKIAGLVSRFPERELAIRRLYARDDAFRAVCDDYEEALMALRHWQATGDDAKAEDYRRLSDDLEAEILAILDRPRGCRPHPDDG